MTGETRASEAASSDVGSVPSTNIRVCGIDIADPPFYLFTEAQTNPVSSDQPRGLVYDLIEAVSGQLKLNIELQRSPWNRCLRLLEYGQVDGVLGASYLSEREAIGHYPTTPAGAIDYSRIVYSNTYWLYTNDETVSWDGNVLELPSGGVAGTGLGYSSGNLLRNLGAKLHQEYHPSTLAKLLRHRRISVIAGYAEEIEPFLASQSLGSDDDSAEVRKLSIPLSHDDMFLLVSKPFYRSHPQLVESIWDLFAEYRRNGRYIEWFSRYQSRPPR